MRIIKKYRDGDSIPDGAKYLKSCQELDYANAYTTTETDYGILFHDVYVTTITPEVMYHYYEVTEDQS